MDFKNLERIYCEAADIASDADRTAYLDHACAGDRSLREEVVQLLSVRAQADHLLDKGESIATLDEPQLECPGAHIGLYKLLEQIGEGGMGLVFMAEQTQPMRRKVALKVLKPGMDTRHVVARFEAERQALALMDHPNIAKIHDGGVTPSGRPYFVMELVRGIPITEFCDNRRLNTRQRLELFVTVCHAVQHAHQKGIIHRDLKPSNILVTLHDTIAVPKIIDFGIAKATKQPLTERSLFTHFSQMIGTPLYMSPEQAEMNGLDVDTRSDVYALGVLLYELLTGTTPFASERLKKIGFDEMRRVIREEEPPRPSQRVSTLQAAARSTLSEQRGKDVRSLELTLRGELDWIVIKALEKDRNRRYESASAFAADVQRYLTNEAVEACPPSRAYRCRKFVGRHWQLLTTVCVILMAFGGATAISAWQAAAALRAQGKADEDRKQAEADRDRAKTAELQATFEQNRALEAERLAATESAVAKAISEFLQHDLLRQVNSAPKWEDALGYDRNLTVKEALDRAAARIGDRFKDSPLVEAAIRTTIADAYTSLGEQQAALPHYQRSVAIHEVHFGSEHPEMHKSLIMLASNYLSVAKVDEAIVLFQQVLKQRATKLGANNSLTLEVMTGLGSAYEYAGDWDKSISLFRQVTVTRRETLGDLDASTKSSMVALGIVYGRSGRYREAIDLLEHVFANSTGAIVPVDVYQMHTLAHYYQLAGDLDKADRLLRIALASASDDTAPHRGQQANLRKTLGQNFLLQKKYAEAELILRESMAIYENLPAWLLDLPNTKWRPYLVQSLLGEALFGQQKGMVAEPYLRRGLEGLLQCEKTMLAADRRNAPEARERLVRFYEATNQPEKAMIWRK